MQRYELQQKLLHLLEQLVQDELHHHQLLVHLQFLHHPWLPLRASSQHQPIGGKGREKEGVGREEREERRGKRGEEG